MISCVDVLKTLDLDGAVRATATAQIPVLMGLLNVWGAKQGPSGLVWESGAKQALIVVSLFELFGALCAADASFKGRWISADGVAVTLQMIDDCPSVAGCGQALATRMALTLLRLGAVTVLPPPAAQRGASSEANDALAAAALGNFFSERGLLRVAALQAVFRENEAVRDAADAILKHPAVGGMRVAGGSSTAAKGAGGAAVPPRPRKRLMAALRKRGGRA